MHSLCQRGPVRRIDQEAEAPDTDFATDPRRAGSVGTGFW